jgi:predicted DNA-binding ribbon-helix-helix protein
MMRDNINRKRSIVVSSKRTSVSLEDSFWCGLKAIARMENVTIEKYIEQINVQRRTPNLSSNLRIAILEYFLKNSRSEWQQIVAGVSPITTKYPDVHHGRT